jgi:hypothetical protein
MINIGKAVLFYKKEPKNFFMFDSRAWCAAWPIMPLSDKKFLLLFSKRSASLNLA